MTPTDKHTGETIPLLFHHNGTAYSGFASPIKNSCSKDACFELEVTLNGQTLGTIACGQNMIWRLEGITNQAFIDKIGNEIVLWYE